MYHKLTAFFLILTVSCSESTDPHLADLSKFSSNTSEITMFSEPFDGESTEPSHNIIPPHGRIGPERIATIWDDCVQVSGHEFCFVNKHWNSTLKISVKKDQSSTEKVFNGFISINPQRLYKIINYGNATFGLVHSYGFSVYHQGAFCKTYATNPNSKMRFGIDAHGTPLIFSSAPITEVDKMIEGWRRYVLSEQCSV